MGRHLTSSGLWTGTGPMVTATYFPRAEGRHVMHSSRIGPVTLATACMILSAKSSPDPIALKVLSSGYLFTYTIQTVH